jgi:SLOG cluster2/TIR domain
MTYPVPLQVHVIWHPKSDSTCRPLAEKIYLTFNRDAYQPLVPGIGIPVFFRCAGGDDNPDSSPARIAIPDTQFDLRIALLTSDFVIDPNWQVFLESSTQEVRTKSDSAALIGFGLNPGMGKGGAKVIQLDSAGERTTDLLTQHVLLQGCRLLGGRPRTSANQRRGAAPMRLFLSHTKRDTIGLQTAEALKKYLDNLAVDRFFDDVSIQPGDDITQELVEGINDSALVAIRTDGYVASPWCRKELALAKRARRPMVIVDALTGTEARSSPFLANLPSIRVNPGELTENVLDRVTNFIGLEVLRFLHADRQLALLKVQGLLPREAVLLARPPEARDLVMAAQDRRNTGTARPVFAHPDPVLTAEESEDLSFYAATLVTPTTLWHKRLERLRLGISASSGEEPDLAAIGLSRLHIEDAVRIFARQGLASGATLVYGGSLVPGNLTEALFEMIGAYNKGGLVEFPRLINYSAWPWSQEVDAEWLAKRRRMLEVRPCEPPADAKEFSAGDGRGHVQRLMKTAEGRYALTRSLSAMRQKITEETDARVVLGGKVAGFSGLMPGIVEEVLLAIRRSQPVYVAGGFGGAAHVVAAALQGQRPPRLSNRYQQSISSEYSATLSFFERRRSQLPSLGLAEVGYDAATAALEKYGVQGVAATNGLTEEENLELFTTGSADAALFLVMKGLCTIWH